MNILNIAFYTIKRNFRDRKTLSSMLLLPIVLILILGTALSSQFTPAKAGKAIIAYQNLDGGEMSKHFEGFLSNVEIKEMVEVKTISSYDEGKKLIEDKKAHAMVIIEKGYTQGIMEGKKGEIKVYSNKSGTYFVTVVQNIVDSFVDSANTIQAVSKLQGKVAGYSIFNNLDHVSIAFGGNSPRAIDYYAVAMLVMTLMYGTMYGCFGLGEDLFESLGFRMRSTPLKSYEIFLGKTLGSILTLFIQALVIILFSKFAYGANWGSSIGMILWISFSLSFLAIGLGIMVTLLSKDHIHASRVLSIMVPISTLISGGYAKFGTMPLSIEKIKFFVPNQLGHTAFFNTVYGGSTAQVTKSLTAIWVMVLAALIVSATAGRRLAR